jgi:molybdenum cofactor sulfurtransferase
MTTITTDSNACDRGDALTAAFARQHPEFDPDGSLDRLRRAEYTRLDATGTAYLDYTGGGLHSSAQVAAHAAYLDRGVLGNPHSGSTASLAATADVEHAREAVLAFFGTSSDDYVCIFTPNASGALKLVGEAYPFGGGGTFALTVDNHNSVNGIRELARRAGADVVYVPVRGPELRIDRDQLSRTLATRPAVDGPRLFAFPAQSNYSGVHHPLEIVTEARRQGWDVVLDASAFVPTNRLDLTTVRPAFVVASFYKVFGYPTGIGCLLVRRDRLGVLRRPWFAGGTVTIASVGADGHYLHDGAAGFEDGTVDYLNLPAVTIGLAHVETVGRDALHERVVILTRWLLERLATLRHSDGTPVVTVLGPTDSQARGGTVTFVVHDRGGRSLDGRLVESLANHSGISLRSGCFCNPGAAEVALGIDAELLRPWFGRTRRVTFDDLVQAMRHVHGRTLAAVRVSFGIVSNGADVARLVSFLERFVDADEWSVVDECAGGVRR